MVCTDKTQAPFLKVNPVIFFPSFPNFIRILAAHLLLFGCSKANNTFEGVVPNNPISQPSINPSPSPTMVGGSEFSTLAVESSTQSNNYRVSATLGDKNLNIAQNTSSGRYKVFLAIQGVKASNPDQSPKK